MKHTIRPIPMEDAADVGRLLKWSRFRPNRRRPGAGCAGSLERPRRERILWPRLRRTRKDRSAAWWAWSPKATRWAVGVTGHTLMSDPRLRGVGAHLVRRYAETPDVFGVFHYNANGRSAPLYERFGFTGCPARPSQFQTGLADRSAGGLGLAGDGACPIRIGRSIPYCLLGWRTGISPATPWRRSPRRPRSPRRTWRSSMWCR